MKIYFSRENLSSRFSSLSISFVYESYVIRIFTLVKNRYKRLNVIKYILRNKDKITLTFDIYYLDPVKTCLLELESTELNIDIVNLLLERSIQGNAYSTMKNIKIIDKWKQKNIINT